MPRTLTLGLLVLLAVTTMPFSARGVATAQAPAGVPVPTIPDPVAVSLDASTTVFLALDLQTSNCGSATAPATLAPRPDCVASLPVVNSTTATARATGVPVIYTYTPGGTLSPGIISDPSDVMLQTFGADKFFNTNLDDLLKGAGATTVVITGTASNGAVLYTSVEAAVRGYTVVIAVDGLSASSYFPTLFTEWQLLTAPGATNAQNTPLQPKAVTLSRTDLITYK
jgi:nicotinamidase-related amidase